MADEAAPGLSGSNPDKPGAPDIGVSPWLRKTQPPAGMLSYQFSSSFFKIVELNLCVE